MADMNKATTSGGINIDNAPPQLINSLILGLMTDDRFYSLIDKLNKPYLDRIEKLERENEILKIRVHHLESKAKDTDVKLTTTETATKFFVKMIAKKSEDDELNKKQ